MTGDGGDVFAAVVDYIQEKLPSVFILENVVSLMTRESGSTWNYVLSTLWGMGIYRIYTECLSPHRYGWPQSRSRVFIVGRICRAPFEWPAKRPMAVALEDVVMERHDAVLCHPSCARPLTSAAARTLYLLRAAADKKGVDLDTTLHIVNLGESEGRERLGTVGVAPCVTSKSSCCYIPVQHRYLTPHETLLLQGFSPDHPGMDTVSTTNMHKLAGNAIHVGVLSLILSVVLSA